MRLFLGVFPDTNTQLRLAAAVERLRCGPLAGYPLRWSREEQLHVTLRFLGERDEAFVAALEQELPPILARLRHFRVVTDGLGAFASPERARVLFAALRRGAQELRELEAAVAAPLARHGVPPEGRAYSPHLTLARARRGQLRLPDLRHLPLPELEFHCEALRLVCSRLGPDGAWYETLREFRLGP